MTSRSVVDQGDQGDDLSLGLVVEVSDESNRPRKRRKCGGCNSLYDETQHRRTRIENCDHIVCLSCYVKSEKPCWKCEPSETLQVLPALPPGSSSQQAPPPLPYEVPNVSQDKYRKLLPKKRLFYDYMKAIDEDENSMENVTAIEVQSHILRATVAAGETGFVGSVMQSENIAANKTEVADGNKTEVADVNKTQVADIETAGMDLCTVIAAVASMDETEVKGTSDTQTVIPFYPTDLTPDSSNPKESDTECSCMNTPSKIGRPGGLSQLEDAATSGTSTHVTTDETVELVDQRKTSKNLNLVEKTAVPDVFRIAMDCKSVQDAARGTNKKCTVAFTGIHQAKRTLIAHGEFEYIDPTNIENFMAIYQLNMEKRLAATKIPKASNIPVSASIVADATNFTTTTEEAYVPTELDKMRLFEELAEETEDESLNSDSESIAEDDDDDDEPCICVECFYVDCLMDEILKDDPNYNCTFEVPPIDDYHPGVDSNLLDISWELKFLESQSIQQKDAFETGAELMPFRRSRFRSLDEYRKRSRDFQQNRRFSNPDAMESWTSTSNRNRQEYDMLF